MMAGATPSTTRELRAARVDVVQEDFREVADGAGLTAAADLLAGREGVLGAAGADELVSLAQRSDRSRTDRVAHRVAGGHGGGDDRGAEHQPDDDQRTTPRPAGDVADTELEQDAVANRQHGDQRQRNPEQSDQDDRQRLGRNAEQLVHDDPSSGEHRRVGERDFVTLAARRLAK